MNDYDKCTAFGSPPEEALPSLEIAREVLLDADRDAFIEALLNPPEPTKKLVAALKRHHDLLG
jgi:uncharacterized protein (DUF1778 family)